MAALADTYRHIHRQQRSAWTQEVDLRPFKETFCVINPKAAPCDEGVIRSIPTVSNCAANQKR
jgi:hypothetical protein